MAGPTTGTSLSISLCHFSCSYQGIDAYDLSSHLHDNSYSGNKKNTNVAASSARVENSIILSDPGSTGDDTLHPEVGNLFMYHDNSDHSGSENNSCTGSLGKGRSDGCPGGSKLSSQISDNGDASLSTSASFACKLSDLDSDDTIEEEDSDTSLNAHELYEEKSFPFGVDDVVHVSLANLCCRIKAPLKAYNKILRWAQDAKVQGYSFPVDAPQYSTFIAQLKKRLNVNDYIHKTSTVEAAGGGTVSFPVFDFQNMFLSLIDDPQINGHLLVNWEDPFAPPSLDKGYLDKIHSRMRHDLTLEMLTQNNSNEIFCSIVLAIDRMHTVLEI
jgi:hypothetical protein